MDIKEAYKILGVDEKTSYCEVLKKCQTYIAEFEEKYGIDSNEYVKQGIKVLLAFCFLMNTGKYNNERFKFNFDSFFKE